MEIEFLNLQKAYIECKDKLDQLWHDVNEDALYVLGNRLNKFEKEFANYLGIKNTIGTANGLDALSLCLKSLNIGNGMEVIVPAFTFIATWLAVSQVGATPVPVDINSDYLIDPHQIKTVITPKTTAIMPVHLYGRLCDMKSIMNIAKEYNLKIIEDAAQAHGAYDQQSKQKAGTFGQCAAFSFYPGKNLGCFGDGGCVTTADDSIVEHVQLLRNYGSKIRYEHEIQGTNSRLDELQAGILSIKLECLDHWNRRRQYIAKLYLSELKEVGDLIMPSYDEGHVWHIFAVRTKQRNKLKEFLTLSGIGVHIHYPKPIHLQKSYSYMNFSKHSFPVTEQISDEVLSLPIGPHLKEHEAVYCIKKIREFFSKN